MLQIPARTGKERFLKILEEQELCWPVAFRISRATYEGTQWHETIIIEIDKVGTVRILAKRDALKLKQDPNLAPYVVWKGTYYDFTNMLSSSIAPIKTALSLVRQFVDLRRNKEDFTDLRAAILYVDFKQKSVWIENDMEEEYDNRKIVRNIKDIKGTQLNLL